MVTEILTFPAGANDDQVDIVLSSNSTEIKIPRIPAKFTHSPCTPSGPKSGDQYPAQDNHESSQNGAPRNVLQLLQE